MLTFLNGKNLVDLNYANKLKQINKIIKEKKKRKKNIDNKGEHFHFFSFDLKDTTTTPHAGVGQIYYKENSRFTILPFMSIIVQKGFVMCGMRWMMEKAMNSIYNIIFKELIGIRHSKHEVVKIAKGLP